MSKKLQFRLGIAGSFFLSLIIISVYFSSDILHMNDRVFLSSNGGDGVKAYYCYLYHIEHDSTFMRFDGMNYPYGESVLYTDNQPLLSEIMRGLGKIFPGITNYSIGIWNLLLLISIALGAVAVFLVLAELGLPVILSMLFGIGITFLSPQIDRMGAHYSLTYIFFIPLAILFLLKYLKDQKLSWSLAICGLIIFAGLTHMYFVAMILILVGFFWAFFVIARPGTFWKWRVILMGGLIQIILPLIIIQLFDILSSDVSDRGSSPYGFLIYLAHPFSIFLPHDKFYGDFFRELLAERKIEWEGYAYVGIVAVAGFVLVVGKLLFRLIKLKFRTFLSVGDNSFLTYLFWCSILMLLVSFGIPFIYGLEELVEYLGPVKQIRSLGRFAWIFYYAINILAAYLLWDLYRKSRIKILSIILIVGALGVLLVEGNVHLKPKGKVLTREYPLLTDYKNEKGADIDYQQINPDNYQSILSLPYFHIGSEYIWERPACGIKEKSFEISLKSGLPLNAVMMGRTSLAQTRKSIDLTWVPHGIPEILDDFPSDKPILVLSADCVQLSEGERLIVESSELVEQIKGFKLSRITPAELRKMSLNYVQSNYRSRNFDKKFDASISGKFASGNVYYNAYSGLTDNPGFIGQGAYKLPKIDHVRIFRDSLPNFDLPADISVSFWVKDIVAEKKPRLQIETATVGTDGKTSKYYFASFGKYLSQIHDDWGLIEYVVKMDPGEILSIAIFRQHDRSETVIDDFLIRRTDEDVYGHIKDGDWILNNHYFEKEMIE